MYVLEKFFMVLILFVFIEANALQRNEYKVTVREGPNDVGTPCSTNISNAYINIYLLVDVSTNMGAANLRQLGLSLSSTLSEVTIAGINDPHTSRIAIITYADTATVIANTTAFNSNNDVANALMSLKLSNSSSSAGIDDAFNLAFKMTFDCWLDKRCNLNRKNALVFIGASMNGVNASKLISDINYWDSKIDKDMDRAAFESIITINWNQTDALLKNVFDQISYPSQNLSKSDKQVYEKFVWALAQANCYCLGSDVFQLLAYNTAQTRWERYADCYSLIENIDRNPDATVNVLETCTLDIVPKIPIDLTSNEKQIFLQTHVIPEQISLESDLNITSYYIGLHRNQSSSSWKWFDYNGQEFSLGSYAPWYPGYNETSPGDCIVAKNVSSDLNVPFRWVPTSCLLSEGVYNVFCQQIACDTDRTVC